MPQSKKKRPAKPYPDFPLFPHGNGCWAKKIRGRLCYFGPWADPDAAFAKYEHQRHDLYAGRQPTPVDALGPTLDDLLGQFVAAQTLKATHGRIVRRTLDEYVETCDRLAEAFDLSLPLSALTPPRFVALMASWPSTWGPVRRGNEIRRIRTILTFAFDDGLVDVPIRTGSTFRPPTPKELRLLKASRPERLFTATEIVALLAATSGPMRAMILLGINAGIGNRDAAGLELGHLSGDWLNYPRPKTGVQRRAKLWPQTVAALADVLGQRPKPKCLDDADLVFLTERRTNWRPKGGGDPISRKFARVLERLDLRRQGVGYYSLRHTFATVAGDTGDQVAVDHVMGHAPASSDMAAVYRKRIADARLEAVAEHVRAWLFNGDV